MTCWTCEQQLRQSAVHPRRRISESTSYIYRSLQHARLRRRQNRTVHAALNLKQNLRSTYCNLKLMTDVHEAARGLFVTAELLVGHLTNVRLIICFRVPNCIEIWWFFIDILRYNNFIMATFSRSRYYSTSDNPEMVQGGAILIIADP